MQKKKNIKMY